LKRRGRQLSGILLLDKGRGVTSNRALQQVKRLYGAAKAGHTGSLDPLATGMLPICFGAATKVSGFLLAGRKTYRVGGRFGVATDTGDAEGAVVGRHDRVPLEEAALRGLLVGFVGEIEQVPPMYSALKHEGKRLYALAREGAVVPRSARSVTIHSIELVGLDWPEFEFVVSCSKGTYVRSLVSDIASVAGTLAHVIALRRTGAEPFETHEMYDFATLQSIAEDAPAALDELLLPADTALASWPSVDVDAATAARVRQGQAVVVTAVPTAGPVRIYAEDDGFIGIGEFRAGQLHPRRLLS
jgi:tRNA pseudouridine55 synthase